MVGPYTGPYEHLGSHPLQRNRKQSNKGRVIQILRHRPSHRKIESNPKYKLSVHLPSGWAKVCELSGSGKKTNGLGQIRDLARQN